MQLLLPAKHGLKFFFFVWACCFTTTAAIAQSEANEYEFELLVQLQANEKIDDLVARISGPTRQTAALEVEKTIDASINIYLLSFDPQVYQRQKLLETIRADRAVAAAQINDEVSYRSTFPNDPFFPEQWHLDQIDATQAWDITTGGVNSNGDTIVIAVIDKGCDIMHEDIRPNLWSNNFEIPDDGIDNDSNGYTDDYWGLYIKEGTDEHPNRTHGCAVSGLIGAKGSNATGVTGVLWNTKMMFVSGATTIDEIVEAYMYVYKMRKKYNETNGQEGAFVVATNFSAGIDLRFCDEYPVWGAMYDMLGQVGILNVGATTNTDINVDISGDMPTTCPSDFLLTVTSTDRNDNKAERAGFGQQSIDIGSPGVGITSAKPNNTYGNVDDGTSWATPIVTSAVAMMYSANCTSLTELSITDPPAAALAVKQLIMEGADPSLDLEDRTVSGGRLNLFHSLEALDNRFGNPKTNLSIFDISPNPARNSIKISYTIPESIEYQIRVFDAVGRLIDDTTVPRICASGQVTLNVNNLPAGIYFVSIGRDKTVETKRFLKY